MALLSRLDIKLAADLTSVLDHGTAKFPLLIQKAFELASGTGAGQADLVFGDLRALAAGANEDLDVAGALAGPLGGTLAFVKVKGILVAAAPANTVNLTLSRPASNGLPFFAAAGDAVVLTPGGLFILWNPSAAGIAVTAGTGDLINVAAGAGSGSQGYDVAIIGASA